MGNMKMQINKWFTEDEEAKEKFTVTDIQEDEEKANYVKLTLDYKYGETRTFRRKEYTDKYSCKCSIIEGFKIKYHKEYDAKLKEIFFVLDGVEKKYDTKGIKKIDTSTYKSQNIPHTYTATVIEPKKEEEEVKEAEEILNKVKTSKYEHVNLDEEVKHYSYDDISMMIELNIPVFLAGPAGAGKNFTVEQIAKDIDYDFFYTNSIQQEYKLTGFIDACGDFHDTEFYKACVDEKDCIFFLDEIDASIPEVLVLINSAIANGYFEFPTGRVDLKNVHFVAAGNTVGTGADDMYTGRFVLDAATLDRFAIIDFGYDTRVEMYVSKNNDSLVEFIEDMRNQSEEKGIRATFSLRCIVNTEKLEAKGMDLKKILKMVIFKGIDKDTMMTFDLGKDNKYFKAAMEMRKAA